MLTFPVIMRPNVLEKTLLLLLSFPDCIHAQRYCVKVELWNKNICCFHVCLQDKSVALAWALY